MTPGTQWPAPEFARQDARRRARRWRFWVILAADAWESRFLAFWRRAFEILRSSADAQTKDRLLDGLTDEQFAYKSDPTYLMNAILVPALGHLETRIDHSVALSRLRVAAIDVVAYRQKNGRWPGSLEQACRPVPLDPFDGKPLHYRRTAGGFVLYSIGEDRKDDGGKMLAGRPNSQPDIVVQYPLPR